MRSRSRNGQAFRDRDCRGMRSGSDANHGWEWLREGFPGRAFLSRRAAADHRGWNERATAAGNRSRAIEKVLDRPLRRLTAEQIERARQLRRTPQRPKELEKV